MCRALLSAIGPADHPLYTHILCLQDWVYFERHSMELTLELNAVMKPPAHEVAGAMWSDNLPALMRFVEMVRQSRGTGQGGDPLLSCFLMPDTQSCRLQLRSFLSRIATSYVQAHLGLKGRLVDAETKQPLTVSCWSSGHFTTKLE